MPIIRDPRTGKQVELFDEPYDAWCAELRLLRDTACKHDRLELRVRQIGGQRVMILHQCHTRGEGKGGAVAQNPVTLASPSWDEALLNQYKGERAQMEAAISIKYCDLAAAERSAVNEVLSRTRFDYEEYLRSEVWQRKRALVLKRANGLCEGCMLVSAEVVHHTTYRNKGHELLFELVALCHQCHDKAHPEHRECFYDRDYSPCDDCRWAVSEGGCGRFDQPRYMALSANGECGPKWDGFEGLR